MMSAPLGLEWFYSTLPSERATLKPTDIARYEMV